jgi:membrane protease YdiL (CAAX protease family)
VTAVLFAFRHHPSDIYFGLLNHASALAWVNRFVGLYALAFIFGFVRERVRSTWASWICHMLMEGTIIIVGHLWRWFLPG